MSARTFVLFSYAAVSAFALACVCGAQEYLPDLSIDHPAIQYFQRPLDDAVARLVKQVESGKARLDFDDDELRNVSRLLERLGVNPDSQALVFSKTSFQSPKISPSNPRAIYFSDDVAIGFVRGSADIEIAAIDPKQGVVFYTANLQNSKQPGFSRRDVCLRCHQGPATSGVPGMFVGSVFPGPLGAPSRAGAIITDHRTAFEDRWGGWYINATRGQQRDRSNAVASNPAEPEELDTDRQQNLTSLLGKFNPAGYLTPVSDIVALMTFEHQTQMTNSITRVGWQARIAEHDGKTDDLARAQIGSAIEAMVTYMLFVDEVLLPAPIQGVSTFTKTFPQRGPRDRQGRSLRDFDLQKRLFRYPLSYMVYSAAFNALPDNVLERVYQRLYDVLTGKDESKKFAKLSQADRHAILDILQDTKPNLPAYWRARRTGR